MRVKPLIIWLFLTGITVNSLGRLVLTPLKIPIGLSLTTGGYFVWAGSYVFICLQAVTQRRFNKHLMFWLLFTALAPVQFNAARGHKVGLNQVTTAALLLLLAAGSVLETRYYLQRRAVKQLHPATDH